MKSVNPKVYNTHYYLNDCSGYKEFNKYFGRNLNKRFRKTLSNIKVFPGMKILDIGCGRGEAAFWSANKGARVIGIDYSKEGIKIANNALRKQKKSIKNLVKFELKNAKEIKYKPNQFDAIFMLDILEHLFPKEQQLILRNAYRVLKKNGTLLAHTEPNKTYLNFTYPLYCYPISKILINVWNLFMKDNHDNLPHPSKLRTKSHKIMHINEPTYISLCQQFRRAGFKIKMITETTHLRQSISWKDDLYNIIVFLFPISKHFPLNVLFSDDFIITAKK